MGGVSSSNSQSQSSSSGETGSFDRSQSGQDVWGAQSPYLSQLYNMGSGLAGQQGGIGDAAANMSGNYLGQMQGLVDRMGGNYTNPYQQGLGSFNPSQTSQYANAQNPYAQQQVEQFGSNLGQFFREQINPAITGNSQQVSQMGGSRQGLAQAGAINTLGQQFQQGATGIMNNAYNTGAGMAQAADQMRLSGMGQAGQLAGMGQGMNLQGMGQAMQSMPNMFNMGMQPYQAAWMPLQNLAGLLGGPTVLGQSQSMGGSYGRQQSSGSSSGSSFGMEIAGLKPSK